MLTNTHVVAVSGNAKTGPMPVTYRPESTCPRTCPFLPKSEGGNGGCYGTGRIFGIARKYSATLSHDDAVKKLMRAPRGAKYLRDRVVGDLVAADGSFDMFHVLSIATIAKEVGLRPFGYTHAWPIMTRAQADMARAAGYTLNASCETEEDVRRATDLGMPTVITGDHWEEGSIVAGRRIVTCPAQTRDDTDCARCGLCAKPDRACTVRFEVHGTARKQARDSIIGRATTEAWESSK